VIASGRFLFAFVLFSAALASVSCVGPVGSLVMGRGADVPDIVYTSPGRPSPMVGDIYHPPAGGRPARAVLMIHGDGRIGDDGRWQMAGLARKLAKQGYVVFNITYRMAPEWTYPAPLVDVEEALDWMREHGEEHGIDPNRIAVYGYSAGGYAGSLGALVERGKGYPVKAIVLGGSPSDLTYYSGGELMRKYLGGTKEEFPALYHEASPVNHVTRQSPPFFLFHGDRDTLVNPDHLQEMHVELMAKGVEHEIYWIRGKGHIAAFLFPGGAIDASIRFLDRHLTE
jgi:acetyl esterase/lipase